MKVDIFLSLIRPNHCIPRNYSKNRYKISLKRFLAKFAAYIHFPINIGFFDYWVDNSKYVNL